MKALTIIMIIANALVLYAMLNAPYYDEKTNRFYYRKKPKNENTKENDDPVF